MVLVIFLTHCMPELRHARDAPLQQWRTKSFSSLFGYFYAYRLKYPANSALHLLGDYQLQPLKAKRAADWIQEGLQRQGITLWLQDRV